MAGKTLTPEQILNMLAGAPGQIAEMVEEVESAILRAAPNPGEWCPNEVLAHLRSCADVWGGCIDRILAEDYPTIRAMNPRTWMEHTDYPTQDFHASLDAYTRQRADLIAMLAQLSMSEWERAAKIVGAGKPLERTVFSYAEGMAVHERPHLKQIARAVKGIL